MNYPTMQEVENADKLQLAKWYRFLPSPGSLWCGRPEFEQQMRDQGEIQKRILERFQEMGGWTPEISKQVGW